MILYEFEAKKMLAGYGISVPKSEIITKAGQEISLKTPLVLKAQVLSGKRKVAGGIVTVDSDATKASQTKKLLTKTINGEGVKTVLIEEKIDFTKEYYISISYDSDSRAPVLTFSEKGGTGIEDRGADIIKIDPLSQKFDSKKVPKEVLPVVPVLLKVFFDNDFLLLEVNPLVLSKTTKLIALDAKVKIDDSALDRHKDWAFPPRSAPGHTPTTREVEAKKIDENDYRGTAGSTYFDLPGDIAVLASGGGASLTAMDALIAEGGFPANYTEYSGNPPKEKVEKLTQIVLSRENLHGLWIVGAIANFTNIYETLSGFLEALRKINPKPNYPIVIRRGGPHDKEAFEMLKKVTDFDFHLYGEEISITESAKIMANLAKTYAATDK